MEQILVSKALSDNQKLSRNTTDEFNDRGVNVKKHGASGSNDETTGSIESNSKILIVENSIDFEEGQGIRIFDAFHYNELNTLTINSNSTSDAEIRIYYNETYVPINITNGESATSIASKIRSSVFEGWTTGGTGNNVTFSANTYGKQLLYYVRGSSNVTATLTTSVVGSRDLVTKIEKIEGNKITLRDAAVSSALNTRVLHDDTEALLDIIENTKYEKILFPKGTYLYYNIYAARSNLTIEGYGATLVSWIPVGDAKNCFHLIGSNLTVRGLSFEYDRPFDPDTTFKPQSHPGGNNNVRLGGERSDKPNPGWQENIIVEDIKVNGGYGGGLDIYFANRCFIRRNEIRNTLGNGLNFSNCQYDIFAEYNLIDFTRDDGIQNVCDNNWTYGTENYNCRYNRVLNSYAKAVSTTGVSSGILEKNFIKNSWSGGIQPFRDAFYGLGGTTEIIVQDNTIIDAGKNYGEGKYRTERSANCDGIYVSNDGTTFIKFIDNRIFSPERHGVVVSSGSKGISFIGTKIYNANGKGFNIGNTNDDTYTSAYQIDIVGSYIYDAWEEGILIGGTNEGDIRGNYIKNWNRSTSSNYSPISIKNAKNINVEGNRFNNEESGHINPLIKLDGLVRNITDNGNKLLTDSNDFAPDMIMVGTKKIAFVTGGKPIGNLWSQGDLSFDTSPIIRGKGIYSCVRTGRSAPAWTGNTPISVGTYIQPVSDNGHYYVCTVAGTTGSSQPSWSTGSGSLTTDNGVTWQEAGTSALFRAYPGLDESKWGTNVWSSDGTSNSVNITHGLGAAPNRWFVTPASVDAGDAGVKYVTADSTKLTVFFNTIPVSGKNITLKWEVGL